MKKFTKWISALLALVLLCGTALSLASCDESTAEDAEYIAQQQKIDSLTAQIEALKTTVAQSGSQSEIDSLTAQIETLKEALKQASDKTTVDALNAQIEELSKTVEQLTAENESLGASLSTLLPTETTGLAHDYGVECYQKIKFIDENLSDRDAYNGENFAETVSWIKNNLYDAGYTEDEVFEQEFTITRYASQSTDLATAYSAVKAYETDDKLYKRQGRNYIEDENGTYVKLTLTLVNVGVIFPYL